MKKPISEAGFLKLLKAQRNRKWRLDGHSQQAIRCGQQCPIEIVFPDIPHAFRADDAGLLTEKQVLRIINAADNGFNGPVDKKLRRKLLLAVGLVGRTKT